MNKNISCKKTKSQKARAVPISFNDVQMVQQQQSIEKEISSQILFLDDKKPEATLLHSTMKQIMSENLEIINCYQEMIHAFKGKLKEHQDISLEIEEILSLSEQNTGKFLIERNTTVQKLKSLKLRLEEFKTVKQQYHVHQFKNILYYYHGKNKEVIQMTKQFITKPINGFNFSSRLFAVSSNDSQNDIEFLNHNTRLITKNQLKYPQILMAEPELIETSKPGFNKITFKINQLPNKFLYLGAVKTSVMQKDNFKFDRKLGNGVYVIAANSGYSFSNDYQQQNFNPTEFKYGANDTVQIQYNSQQSLLKYANVDKYNETTLKIKRDDNSSTLHFCAIVLNENTDVEIVPEQLYY